MNQSFYFTFAFSHALTLFLSSLEYFLTMVMWSGLYSLIGSRPYCCTGFKTKPGKCLNALAECLEIAMVRIKLRTENTKYPIMQNPGHGVLLLSIAKALGFRVRISPMVLQNQLKICLFHNPSN